MIISQERWDKTFKNFEVYDCTYGFEHGRVGLLLIEKIDENHIEYGNDYYMPKHKLVSIVIDNPPENRVFGMSFGNLSHPTISAGWSPSQTELVIVDIDCEVISYKTREYKGRENNLDIPISKSSDMRTAIIKVVRVGTSVYAIGGGLRIYKRINHQVWLDASQTIPVPDGFLERKAESMSRSLFQDLSGFSESDMYAVGGTGTVYHFNGEQWKKLPFPTNKLLYTVCCAGDGFVYIADFDGAIWKGRNEQWTQITHGGMTMPFLDMGWFDGRLWCASDYGIWVLEDDKLVLAMHAKHKPVPPEVAVLSKRIDVSPDGTVMMVCGSRGAAIYDGNAWNVLFDSMAFE